MSGTTSNNLGPVKQGPQQYLRYLSLVVADDSGNGLDLANLRVVFRVLQNSLQTPNSLIARVYNPAPNTINLIQHEFTKVQLSAGYQGQYGVIFNGTLKRFETGREDVCTIENITGRDTWQRAGAENPVDTFIDIYASDGDHAYIYGVVNRSLAAGYSVSDSYSAIASGWQPYGIQPGALPDGLPQDQQSPRGAVFYGMARDRMRVFAASNGLTYTIRDNQDVAVQTINGFDQDDAIILSSKTGMVAIPQRTVEGLVVRALLNPQFKFNKRVHIDEKDIVAIEPGLAYQSLNYVHSRANDGIYRIISATHLGDTRGQPWYTELVCTSVTGAQPLGGPLHTSVPAG